MANPTRMGSYSASGVDLNGLLVSNMTPEQATSYQQLYGMSGNTLGMSQPFDGMQQGSWPFPMGMMGGEQNAVGTSAAANNGAVPAHTMQSMPNNYGQLPVQSQGVAPEAMTRKNAENDAAGMVQMPRRAAKSPAGKTERAAALETPVEESRMAGKKRTPAKSEKDSKTGRRKIKIEFIDDDSRRHITFSKRKAGIMKKVCTTLRTD